MGVGWCAMLARLAFFVITIANQADRQRRAIYERRCLNLITVLFGWLTALRVGSYGWLLGFGGPCVCLCSPYWRRWNVNNSNGRAGPGRPAVAIFCWALYEFNLESVLPLPPATVCTNARFNLVFIYTRVFLQQRVNAGQREISIIPGLRITFTLASPLAAPHTLRILIELLDLYMTDEIMQIVCEIAKLGWIFI